MDENKTFNISMPKALLDAIDKQAQTEFRNRSDLIREATRAYIASRGGMDLTDNLSSLEESRIKEALNFSNFKSQPAIVLSCAIRPQPNSVKDIFESGSKAVQLLENPKNIRSMGWDLQTLDRARPVAGEYLEVTNGKRKLIRLYRDGQLVFSGGLGFFGHGVNDENNKDYSFNLLSVAEFILNFVIFARQIAESLNKGPEKLIFNIAVSNPPRHEKKGLSVMAYDGIGTDKVGELTLDWAERSISTRKEDLMSDDKVAYLIYSEFSYFFGIRGDALWYVNKEKQEVARINFKG